MEGEGQVPNYPKIERYQVNGIERTPEWWENALRSLQERRGMDRYASTRPWNEDSHLLGMAGENADADALGALLDTRRKLGGDKGVDIEAFMTITGKFAWIKRDTKTARFPKELWTGAGGDRSPTKPDCIYILARYLQRLDAERLGWEWGHEMMRCPKKREGGRWVHYKPRELLRPLSELDEYYCKRWRWFEDPDAPPRGHPAKYPEAPVFVRPIIRCHVCGGDGLYFAGKDKYLCNEHRVW